MNAKALVQYRRTKKRLAKVHQGRAIPRMRHLSDNDRFKRPGGFFKPIPNPTPVLSKGFNDAYLNIIGLISSIPFLSRRAKQWRK